LSYTAFAMFMVVVR